MSYQVLARKWRPAKFAELVGQEHVKSAIINGLTQQRTHHAYLFSGTRGVGKTTIARIFAKSLNCEEGISAEPCNVCSVCTDVNEGRFVDLIEIDAASRTKVGDTREILDNVQYVPTRGRYKIYLIDEVHMLSRHSFNALLKTLEEPPEHVKFLFATTDPQKLPVTILSRCLQFNLQALSVTQIEQQLTHILTAEGIQLEPQALTLLARSARGSMRDALSLTDQAIAQSGGNLTASVIQSMLGTVDQSWSQQILKAIVANDNQALANMFQQLTTQAPDISKLFDDMILMCHQIAMTQLLPAAANLNEEHKPFIETMARAISPAEIQVFYQFLLQGKKELPYCSDPQTAFEMTCLRLTAFQPSAWPVPSAASSESNNETTIEKKNDALESLTESSIEQTPISASLHESEVLKKEGEFEQESAAELKDLESGLNTEPPTKSKPAIEIVNDIQPEPTVQSEQEFAQEHVHKPSLEMESMPLTEVNLEPEVETSAVSEVSSENGLTNNTADIDTNPVLAILASRGMASPDGSNPQPNESNNPLGNLVNNGNNIDPPNHDDVRDAKPLPENTDSELPPERAAKEEIKLLDLEHEEVKFAHQVDRWAAMVEQSDLAGLGRQLALNSEVQIDGNRIELKVRQQFAHLLNEKSEQDLRAVVSRLAPASEFLIDTSELTQAAPADIQQNINQNRQERAEQSIHDDPMVKTLTQEFDAKIIENSIKPL